MRWLGLALFLVYVTPVHAGGMDSDCKFAVCSPAPYNVGKSKAKPAAKARKPVAKPKPTTKPAPRKPSVQPSKPTVEADPKPVETTKPVKVTAVPNVPVEPLNLEDIKDPYIALFDRDGRFYGQYKVAGKVKRVGTAGPMVFEQVCTDEDRKTIFDGRCKRWRLIEKSEKSTDTPYWSFVTESGRLIVWDQVAIVSLTPLPIDEKGILQ